MYRILFACHRSPVCFASFGTISKSEVTSRMTRVESHLIHKTHKLHCTGHHWHVIHKSQVTKSHMLPYVTGQHMSQVTGHTPHVAIRVTNDLWPQNWISCKFNFIKFPKLMMSKLAPSLLLFWLLLSSVVSSPLLTKFEQVNFQISFEEITCT